MSQYAKGPWKCVSGEFKEDGLVAWEIEMPNGGFISKANADLIGAAPELLEALQALRSFMWSEGYADQTAAVAQADAAIAKAVTLIYCTQDTGRSVTVAVYEPLIGCIHCGRTEFAHVGTSLWCPNQPMEPYTSFQEAK